MSATEGGSGNDTTTTENTSPDLTTENTSPDLRSPDYGPSLETVVLYSTIGMVVMVIVYFAVKRWRKKLEMRIAQEQQQLLQQQQLQACMQLQQLQASMQLQQQVEQQPVLPSGLKYSEEAETPQSDSLVFDKISDFRSGTDTSQEVSGAESMDIDLSDSGSEFPDLSFGQGQPHVTSVRRDKPSTGSSGPDRDFGNLLLVQQ